LDNELRSRLLGSIEAGRLVMFCGAGLSIASPSSVPLAGNLAHDCARKYEDLTGEELSEEVRSDLEALSTLIFERNQLRQLLIGSFVDWPRFRDSPNVGHEATADFLLCRAFQAVVSTNYDTHIERAARQLGERDFRAALDGDEASERSQRHAPLLKLHGCCYLDRDHTIWISEQLAEEKISKRLVRSKTWAAQNLRNKDLVFAGFWSDWCYLNSVLQGVVEKIESTEPRLVVLVDPDDEAELMRKAPVLWEWANESAGNQFYHEQAEAERFLDSLRIEASHAFVRKTLTAGAEPFERLGGQAPPPVPDLSQANDSNTLYELRRDMTGVGARNPVKTLGVEGLAVLGATQGLLLARGASLEGSVFRLDDRTIRVVLGSDKLLSQVRALYEDASGLVQPVDEVICVGATPDPTPSNLVRPDRAPNLLRPGVAESWRTEDEILAAWAGEAE
jgi:hypothetical protein